MFHSVLLAADFGLARRKKSAGTSKTNVYGGSFLYMAPEVQFGVVHLASDVFSFGVVALEMFTGLPVFSDSRTYEMLTEHVKGKTSDEVICVDLSLKWDSSLRTFQRLQEAIPRGISINRYNFISEHCCDSWNPLMSIDTLQVCDVRIPRPSENIKEECFRDIELCLRHRTERPDMKYIHRQFQTFFEYISGEGSAEISAS